jgi:hypothetical protein
MQHDLRPVTARHIFVGLHCNVPQYFLSLPSTSLDYTFIRSVLPITLYSNEQQLFIRVSPHLLTSVQHIFNAVINLQHSLIGQRSLLDALQALELRSSTIT